jgi:SAM-dependent methyltransferase
MNALNRDADYFRELQTQTGWGRTLQGFAEWCSPEYGWLTLDVGCGPGLLPAIFAGLGCKAIGVDLDPAMYRPSTLHKMVAIGDVYRLPFPSKSFDLVTASNLLFLLSEPIQALIEMKRILQPGGCLALLNPSEQLTTRAAEAFARERGMNGLGRDTLIKWARRAEEHHRWTEKETVELFTGIGLSFNRSALKVGPGFGRFSLGTT